MKHIITYQPIFQYYILGFDEFPILYELILSFSGQSNNYGLKLCCILPYLYMETDIWGLLLEHSLKEFDY